jgi:hypothetical protein
LIHLGISWYPAVIIYITCWIATLIYYVNGQGKSCCPNATTIFFLFISFAYSIGMFCWLAIKHCLNRIPAYAMLVIRYLVCPLISLALVVIPITNNTFEHENLTMVAQMLSTMELGLGIYLISRWHDTFLIPINFFIHFYWISQLVLYQWWYNLYWIPYFLKFVIPMTWIHAHM